MKIFFIFSALFCLSFPASATKIIGNGGDSYAVEFVDVAREIIQVIPWHTVSDFTMENFTQAVENTTVESTDEELVLFGFPKDAINYPEEKRIVFNRARWQQTDVLKRPILVMHEYLGILGVDDTGYRVSTWYMRSYVYRHKVLEMNDVICVNCGKDTQYILRMSVVLESFGRYKEKINPSQEQLRILVRRKDEQQIFVLPMTGIVVSLGFFKEGHLSDLVLHVMEPVSQGEGWESTAYAVRLYKIKFEGRLGAVPSEISIEGPLDTPSS